MEVQTADPTAYLSDPLSSRIVKLLRLRIIMVRLIQLQVAARLIHPDPPRERLVPLQSLFLRLFHMKFSPKREKYMC